MPVGKPMIDVKVDTKPSASVVGMSDVKPPVGIGMRLVKVEMTPSISVVGIREVNVPMTSDNNQFDENSPLNKDKGILTCCRQIGGQAIGNIINDGRDSGNNATIICSGRG